MRNSTNRLWALLQEHRHTPLQVLAYGLGSFVVGVLMSIAANAVTGVFPRVLGLVRGVNWLGWLDVAIIPGYRWLWGDFALTVIGGLIVTGIVGACAAMARAVWRHQATDERRHALAQDPPTPVARSTQINAGVYLGPNAISAIGENAISLGPNAVNIVGPVVNNGQVGATGMVHPDPDGLFRVQGQVVCPECLRTRNARYPLEQQYTGGSAYGDSWGELTHVPGEPTNKWACSVCGSVFTQRQDS
jgi:hypothetical protein